MNAYVHNIFLIKMNKKKEARGQGFSYVTFPSEIIIKKSSELINIRLSRSLLISFLNLLADSGLDCMSLVYTARTLYR